MVEQDGHHEIHSLHVANGCLIVGVGHEDTRHAILDFCALEVLQVLESSFDVELDVLLGVRWIQLTVDVHITVVFYHLLTFKVHLVELIIVKMNPFLIFEGQFEPPLRIDTAPLLLPAILTITKATIDWQRLQRIVLFNPHLLILEHDLLLAGHFLGLARVLVLFSFYGRPRHLVLCTSSRFDILVQVGL